MLLSDRMGSESSRSRYSFAILVFLCSRIDSALSAYDPQMKMESARLYGNVDAFAYYYVDLLVGSPKPQLASVIVDTGSSIAGFPCANCGHCGKHINPPFDIGGSKTATWLDCSNKFGVCDNECQNGKCSYKEVYTEGSSITGFFFQDFIKLGDTAESNPPVLAQLGCHMKETKLFYTQRANGILGLAPRGNSVTILNDLFQDTSHVNSQIFSMCLADWGGRMNVGGYNTTYHTGNVQWMPMGLGRYYTLTLTQLFLGKTIVADGEDAFGPAMLDSGTTYTYFPEATFKLIDGAIKNFCASGQCGRVDANCWLVSAATGPTSFPTLTMVFNGVPIAWPPTSYLYRRGGRAMGAYHQWCRSYASNAKVQQTVLGATWMLGKEVIFDLSHTRCGVAPANCPSYRRSPHTVVSRRLEVPRVDGNLTIV